MYLKILENVAALIAFHNRQAKIKIEFPEKQFQNEKLSFAHKKKTELSFEVSQ